MFLTVCIIRASFFISLINQNVHKFQMENNNLFVFQGLRDRHWVQICLANGGEIAHGPETRLYLYYSFS